MELSEEQIKELKEKLKDMSPEEIEELKKKQAEMGQQCPFCLMIEGKIQVNKVYEDGALMAILDINPANKGHIILLPKSHYATSFDMSEDEIRHFFNIANELSKRIVQVVKAEGVNMYLANGESAGQKVAHFLLHIIPRFSKDGINFIWKPKEVSDEENNQIMSAFKNFKVEKKIIQQKVEEVEEFQEEERIP